MSSLQPKNQNEKAIRLLEYLEQLANLRVSLVRDIDSYEKCFWLSNVPHKRDCFTQAWGRDEEHEPDEWLEVQNRREPELPAVPPSCKEWVDPSALQRKNDLPELLPQIKRQIQNPIWREGSDQPENISHSERLEDYPEIQQDWESYVENKWLLWVDEHNSWEGVYKVYSALFSIHQEQLRLGEEYELVLGLGLLTWQTPTGQRVQRHLIVADAILEFEARLGKFTVRPHPEGTKLRPELDMLDIVEQPARAEEIAKVSLAAAEDDPWNKTCVEDVLQALVHSIDSRGDYNGSLETKSSRDSAKPIVEYAPALILRKRSTKGLTETLKRIKEQIEKSGDIPGKFADLAEIRPNNDRATIDGPEEANVVFDGEIFFPKPSNDEQLRIVDKMRAASGVLVQGPPGTGKSHTIANLICHLLATGQRTLITAKTPRALRVLEGLVPEELRPLCINLLGSGLEEGRSLESSVGGILRKNEAWNEDSAARERVELEEKLHKLRKEKVEIDRRLCEIRESETHMQSIAEGTYNGTAARIAELVNQNRNFYDWFSDPAPLDKTCPISANDLSGVLERLRKFTPEKRRELSLERPEVSLSPECFTDLVKKEGEFIEEERLLVQEADEQLVHLLEKKDPAVIKVILDAFTAFRDSYNKLIQSESLWISGALRDVLEGNTDVLKLLRKITDEVIGSIEKNVELADTIRIALPDDTDLQLLYNDSNALKEHVKSGGSLGWGPFRPKKVKDRLYLIKKVKVNGTHCSTVTDFSRLAKTIQVRMEIEKARNAWKGRTKIQGELYTLQLTQLKLLNNMLANVFEIEKFVDKCREAINQCSGMGEPVWSDENYISKILSSCKLALNRTQKRCVAEEIQKVEKAASCIATKDDVHQVAKDFLCAVRNRDVVEFRHCVSAIQNLATQRQQLQKMDDELSKLNKLLPRFTESIKQSCNKPYWEERVQQIGEAWRWAQSRNWIEDYIRKEDAPALDKRAKQIEDEINGIIAKLASLHAWSFCFSRLKEEHRRHMEAWQQSMGLLGKGTGKHAPSYRRDAQGHLNECREAVPAWVMPLHRVWDTVYPSQGMFDVIIVDEASQCGVEALPLFYLGKKILIVGDNKQISPDAVGLSGYDVRRLREEYLYDFEFKSSFDVKSSLFDHGKLRYLTNCITLREHFRCMPEIIRFSNDLCYKDTPLIPLRQYGPNRLPPLERVYVNGGYCKGSNSKTINLPEAEAIVERIVQMCDDSRYKGKTMGVVVLQGEAQATWIENQLLKRLGAKEMERRCLICGNPYSFQGDERDIIILSLVAANNERIGPFTKAADERRFNVAASRAKDQMILFHSVTCDDLSIDDLRRKLLKFFEGTKSQQIAGIEQDELERRAVQDKRCIVTPPTPFESWFEVDVALELLRKGYYVIPQYPVAEKRIDLVVEGGQSRLAIECDGDHWHGLDKYEDDMRRQRQLERCGWEFFRIRESAFYSNKNNALDGLWQALEDRDIFSVSRQRKAPSEDSLGDSELVDIDSDVAEDDSIYSDEESSSDNDDNDFSPSGRRAEEITGEEIQKAIHLALAKCPNHTCTLKSLTSRVLKELGVLTRGNPRKSFEHKVKRYLKAMEGQGEVEEYKAKNNRIRLLIS